MAGLKEVVSLITGSKTLKSFSGSPPSTFLAGVVQASYRDQAGAKTRAILTRVGVVAGGPPEKPV